MIIYLTDMQELRDTLDNMFLNYEELVNNGTSLELADGMEMQFYENCVYLGNQTTTSIYNAVAIDLKWSGKTLVLKVLDSDSDLVTILLNDIPRQERIADLKLFEGNATPVFEGFLSDNGIAYEMETTDGITTFTIEGNAPQDTTKVTFNGLHVGFERQGIVNSTLLAGWITVQLTYWGSPSLEFTVNGGSGMTSYVIDNIRMS